MRRQADVSLLEREQQLSEAADVLARTRRGVGGMLVFEGPAGIGKSSLLDAVAQRARGFRVARARPSEIERSLPFGVARRLLGPLAADNREEVFAGPGAAARHALDPSDDGAAGESPSAIFALFWVLAVLAARGPLLLVVDDAQWADEPTLIWLRYVAEHLDEVAVAVVLATRDDTQPPPLAALMAASPYVRVSRVSALGPAAVRSLVERWAGSDADPRVSDTAFAATGGNPFLVGELLRGWRQANSATRLIVTDELRRRLAQRIDAAHAAARALAEAVAVLGGTQVRLRDAAALADLPLDAARAAAEQLRSADLLLDDAALAFSHPLVREAVYTSMGAMRRSAAHAAAADVLRQGGARDETVAAHLLLAEPSGSPSAVATLRRAGRLALRRGAPENAARLLERALDEPPRAEERVDVVRELGEAQVRANDPAAEQTLRAALEQADGARAAEIALLLGSLLVRHGRGRDAERVLQAHLSAADREFALRLEAEIHAAVRAEAGIAVRPTPMPTDDRPDLRGDTPGERLLLASLCFEAAIAAAPKRLQDSLGRRALGNGALIADQGPETELVYFVITSLSHLSPARALLPELDTALEESRRLGSVSGYTIARAWRAEMQQRGGALAEAQADALDALALAVEHDVAIAIPIALFPLVLARIETGQLEQAERDLATYGFGGEIPGAGVFAGLRHARGRLHLALGRRDEARADFMAAGRSLLDAAVITPTIAPWRSDAALRLAESGGAERARALAGEELALARRVAAPRPLGRALRATGLLAEPTERAPLLREAVECLEEAQDPVELARALVDLGVTELRAGDRTSGRERLRVALDLADRQGALAIANRAHEELLVAGARPRRRRQTGRDALTAAEARVARLAAAGRTNREIAAELFLTPKTVETHLSHAYMKLSITGRRGLAQALAPPE